MPFAIFSVGKAGKALNSPSDCYGYGLLLCFTTVLDTGSGWRNIQIYIEDNGSGGAKTGRIYMRSGNTDNGGWKVFTGTKINYVTSS